MKHVVVNYYVNEEKQTVVCKLENCFNAVICNMCHKGWPGHDALLINDTFIGKAKCAPEDTFDVLKGKQIAYNRAVTKFYNAKKKALDRFIKGNEEFMNALKATGNELIDTYDGIIDRRNKDTEKILSK